MAYAQNDWPDITVLGAATSDVVDANLGTGCTSCVATTELDWNTVSPRYVTVIVCVPTGSVVTLQPAVLKFVITTESHPALNDVPPSYEKANLPVGVFWLTEVGVTMPRIQNDWPVMTGLAVTNTVLVVGYVAVAGTTTVTVAELA